MASAMYFDSIVSAANVAEYPSIRGVLKLNGFVLLEKQALPSDPQGATTVTFSGVVVGSEIHVYLPDGDGGSAGTEVAGVESCAANQVLSWPVYAPGSPNNTVFITIIKRGIGWRKFTYQSVVGNQTLPIFQVADLGYNNPA